MAFLGEQRYIAKLLRKVKSMMYTNFRRVFTSSAEIKKDSRGKGNKIINNAIFTQWLWYNRYVFMPTHIHNIS